ncbi:PHP domain-containing protein, partial [Klebsiella pneumoniae]|nr:PHP domain-containing protein [Klebsiella pneumoniae]
MSEAVTNPSPFVHLRVHSEFSVVAVILRIPDLIKRVAKLGQPAVALTDLSNLFGLIKFYKGARGAGIKPIAGCDVWLSNDEDPAKPFRVLLLVRNHQGYLNLCELL